MEEDKKIGKLKAVYTGAVQAGEVEIAEIIKDGINIIENLINKNKELEEENQSYRDYFGTPPCYDNADYIPKSKVREKIEELNGKMAEQVYIIKEFGEHKGNREKLTLFKDYRDAYAELLH